MKIVLGGILVLLSVAARADLSDSGNLAIGGQAVIAGSTTVQGAAFSVGGSTFVVGGGSVTLGGRLNASASGIRWADGSTSTTASSGGGGGDMILSATQTVSGAKVFTSSITVGYSLHTTTAQYASAIIGGWTIVASSNPGGSSAISFTNLNSSYTYRLHYRYVQKNSGSAILRVRFNGDQGSSYVYFVNTIYGDNSTGTNAATSTSIQLSPTGGGVGLECDAAGFMEITPSLRSNIILVNSMLSSTAMTATAGSTRGGGFYSGSAKLSRMDVSVSAGGMDGLFYLEALIPPVF